MESKVKDMLIESAELKRKVSAELAKQISLAATIIIEAYRSGHKVLACGNGGSASQAEHFIAELVGRFAKDRKPLEAYALTSNSSSMTAIGNDYGYAKVFERQVEGCAQKGDVLVILTTSGNSQNILLALAKAKERGVNTIAILGGDGGKAKGMATLEIIVPSKNTPRIQEVHITIIHIMCALVEQALFP